MNYEDIIARKQRAAPCVGFDVDVSDEWLFPFQRHAVRWALAGGRRALFMDTGLGKSRMQLAWADRVCRQTQGRVLLLAPLAVGPQTVRESQRIGLDGVCFARSPDAVSSARIIITNYDSIEKFDGMDLAGIVLDESSILKSFMGSTRAELIRFASSIPYRLAATATPAPNDVEELGNHAEWLGVGTRATMLAEFFVNDSSDTGSWILKGHAVRSFWEWVASWAISASLPSDLGPYCNDGYILPPLKVIQHVVQGDLTDGREDGQLFAFGGVSATTIHGTKRRSNASRAEQVQRIIAAEPDEAWTVWCETNYESEAITALLPTSVEVRGSMDPDLKAARLLDFADGRPGSILVTKPSIAGFGMNWQSCARVVFAGGTYSFEAFYQAIRRSWRFGQRRPVEVHVVMGLAEQAQWRAVINKSEAHLDLKSQMLAASKRMQSATGSSLRKYQPNHAGRLPVWLMEAT